MESAAFVPIAADSLIALVDPCAAGCTTAVDANDHTHSATVIRAILEARHGAGMVLHAQGPDLDDCFDPWFARATYAVESADIAVVVLAGGSAGIADVHRELLEDVVATGTPVVLVVISTQDWQVGGLADRCAAIVTIPEASTTTATGLVDDLLGHAKRTSASPAGTIEALGPAIFGSTSAPA